MKSSGKMFLCFFNIILIVTKNHGFNFSLGDTFSEKTKRERGGGDQFAVLTLKVLAV